MMPPPDAAFVSSCAAVTALPFTRKMRLGWSVAPDVDQEKDTIQRMVLVLTTEKL
jgi:hypothetical protein